MIPCRQSSSHWPYEVWLCHLMYGLLVSMIGTVATLSGFTWPCRLWPGIRPHPSLLTQRRLWQITPVPSSLETPPLAVERGYDMGTPMSFILYAPWALTLWLSLKKTIFTRHYLCMIRFLVLRPFFNGNVQSCKTAHWPLDIVHPVADHPGTCPTYCA